MPNVTSAGVKIYWEEHGAGEPLLLIMGLGATLEWWNRLVPVLSARYRTIVYDNRGVGRSDVPPGPYSIPGMAADAAAVMDAEGLASAHVSDQLVPAENGRIIAKAIPGSRLAMIPRASHIFFTDQFEASTDAVLSFLDQASAETAAIKAVRSPSANA